MHVLQLFINQIAHLLLVVLASALSLTVISAQIVLLVLHAWLVLLELPVQLVIQAMFPPIVTLAFLAIIKLL